MPYSAQFQNLSEESYNELNRAIHDKVNRKQPLTGKEETFFCNCLKFGDLLLYPFCLDEFYYRMFLYRHPLFPKEVVPVKQKDIDIYDIMVAEWYKVVTETNHADQLIKEVARETRKEFKDLRNSLPTVKRDFSSNGYLRKRKQLTEWSKFRYLLIKYIWTEEFNSQPYELVLDGRTILIDQESLAHILSRHFAQTMKTYFSEKSFFTKDISHRDIHTKLQEIFSKIDYYSLFKGLSLDEMTIRLSETIYRIYFETRKIQGKKPASMVRLSTIFPVEDARMLSAITNAYFEYVIDKDLSLFLKT